MLSNTLLKLAGLALGLMLVAGCQQAPTADSAVKAQATPSVSQQPAQQRQAQPQPKAQAEQTIITVHLAQKKSEPELIAVNLGANNNLYALPKPILTQADMKEITPVTAENGSTYIMFSLTPQGSTKLANVSSQARGHYFLVSAKGQLISVAQIADPILDGKLLVSTSDAQHTQKIIQLLR